MGHKSGHNERVHNTLFFIMNFHYYRVSTDSQTLDMQIGALKNYPKDREYKDEGISGKNMDRPGFKALLDQLREGDTVYCYSLSRIGRNALELIQLSEDFNKRGINLVSHVEKLDTTTPMGRFGFILICGIAQLERETTEERRLQGIKVAREKGVKFGRKKVLTVEEIAYIKSCGLPLQDLVERYGVSLSTIKRARKNPQG